jgi:hypothetical protein
MSNFNEYRQLVPIAVGKKIQVSYRFPLSLNSSYSYAKSAIKLEVTESDFYFHDDQFQKFFTFFLMMRLLNTIRSFIKKFDYNMGKSDNSLLDSTLLGLYSFQGKDKVETTLVPNVDSGNPRCLPKSRFSSKGRTGM